MPSSTKTAWLQADRRQTKEISFGCTPSTFKNFKSFLNHTHAWHILQVAECAVVAIEEGRYVHQQIIQSSLESDVFVGCSLVDMYAKCGSIEDAWRVFNKMPSQDISRCGCLECHTWRMCHAWTW